MRLFKRSGMKPVLKHVLVFVLALALIVVQGAGALRPQAATKLELTADPATINGWTAWYGDDVLDTAQVGRIWTDKSVFAGDASLAGGPTVPRLNPDNFLVGLSTLSSNKNIMGTGSTPLDVVFVLDVSSSMRTSANKGTITAMVDATNESIQTLQDLNPNTGSNPTPNRISVVIFDEKATTLLPLDSYTPDPAKSYLSVGSSNPSSSSTTEDIIYVHATDSSSTLVDFNVKASSGTYTQGGLSAALNEFEKGAPKTDRMPILILMSDGSPTIAYTTEYTSPKKDSTDPTIGSALMSYGQGTTGIAFTTQTTAACVYAQMKVNYPNYDQRFYTLGFGLENLTGETGVLAHAVLNPELNTPAMNDYWSDFRQTPYGIDMPNGGVLNVNSRYVFTRVDDGLGEPADPAVQLYVDDYYSADNAGDLQGVFKEIVKDIELQARGFVTNTGGGDPDLSGYVHFEDIIGEYMEVKAMRGLVSDTMLATGALFAKELSAAYAQYLNAGGDLGAVTTPYLDQFIQSSAKRLNILESVAEMLVLNALQEKQIYYNSSSDYGNEFWWYGDGADGYLGAAGSASTPPSGATVLNKSYVFVGKDPVGKAGPSLMYVGVRLKTDLATGRQTVVYTVPASMVPVVEYDIVITGVDPPSGDVVDNAKTADVTKRPATPLALFYEVGLKTGLDADTAAGMVRGDYPYKSGGVYTFYAGDWTKDEALANVTFKPSMNNEFYFFYRDTPVYDGNNVQLTTLPAPGQEVFYRQQTYGLGTGEPVIQKPVLVPEGVVLIENNGLIWVRKHEPKLEAYQRHLPKSANPTDTYIDARTLAPGNTTNGWLATALLGNNGLMRVIPYNPSPQTGDSSNFSLWILIAATSLTGTGLFFVMLIRRVHYPENKQL